MRRPLLAISSALVLLAACQSSTAEDNDQKLSMHREFANAYFDQGQYQKAEAQVDLALEIAPEDTNLRLMKAWICLRRGTPTDVLDAEKRFRAVSSGKDYRAQLGLAETLERKGVMYSESATAVEKGDRATPAKDPKARAMEMRRTAQDSWKEALENYHKALERKPGEIQVINGLQRTYALVGDYEESLRWSDKLLELSSGEIDFWKKQLGRPGITAQEEDNLRKLLAASTKLLVETHLQASTIQHQLGRNDQALAHLDQVVALAPDNVQAYGRRAVLLHSLGRPKQAREDIQEFLRMSTLSIDHPDMKRALELLEQCDQELKSTAQEAR